MFKIIFAAPGFQMLEYELVRYKNINLYAYVCIWISIIFYYNTHCHITAHIDHDVVAASAL